ncbi:MAG: hypothetical protein M3R04_09705, partial [bacterium]|nr:hypothetical protein [bacterium]
MLVIVGMPAISYADDTNFGSRFIRAVDVNGTNWGTPVQVATGAFAVSDSTSLAIVDGKPAIAFQRNNVKYARATDPVGTAWSTFVPVSSTNTRDSINLLMLGDRPIVISRDPDIEVSRANDPVGDSWPATSSRIDGSNRPVSAAIVGGRAAIAYTTGTDQLAFRRAANDEGTVWGPPIIVDSDQLSNFQPSLAVVSGKPAISYVIGSDLMFIGADDADGQNWTAQPRLVAAGASATGQTKLVVIAGLPAAAFSKFPGANRQLWYVSAQDAQGSVWKTPQKVDSTG